MSKVVVASSNISLEIRVIQKLFIFQFHEFWNWVKIWFCFTSKLIENYCRTLLETLKYVQKIEFSKNNKIVNLNFHAKNQSIIVIISITIWIFTPKIVTIQQFSIIVDSVLTQNHDFWLENSTWHSKKILKFIDNFEFFENRIFGHNLRFSSSVVVN